jgi:hypothetical protein
LAGEGVSDIVATVNEDYTLKLAIPRLLTMKLQQIGAGKKVRLEVKRWQKPRTIQQNAYLWSVVYPTICRYIKDVTGQEFTPEDLHERYKRKYLGYEVCEIPGTEDLTRPKSSAKLDTEEFWDQLVEHICREWADRGLYIPLPKKKRGQ